MGAAAQRDIRLDAPLPAIVALAAVLLLANLGNRFLWQDEAQTALIAKTVLDGGIPRGTDGRNSFSQEQGAEYGADGIWKWHTWLSFYPVSLSFALFGETPFAARLPFALFALATVPLVFAAGRTLWRDRHAALAAALLLSLSVPFLLLSRQSRYYALASLLSLWGLRAYARLGAARAAPWALLAAAVLLFHTHYVYAATLLATLLLHAACCERQRLRPVLWVSAASAAQAVPWIWWFASIRLSPEKAGSFLDLSDTLLHVWSYTGLLFGVLFAHGAFLLLPLLLAGLRGFRGEPVWQVSRETWSGVVLLALYGTVTILLLSLLSPLYYVRYLTPLLPPLFLLAGLWLAALWRESRAAAAAVVVLFAATGSLPAFLHEITHDYDGPIEGIVGFLEEHAEQGDLVAMVYGDLPVKFHTGLRVVGGLTGEDLGPAAEARFVILRRHLVNEASATVHRELAELLRSGDYRRHVLAAPDIAFENREDPQLHRFRTVRAAPPVAIWERRPPAIDGPRPPG
ncbi:MAG: hypothetical protein ACR2P8_00175 [Myxococcota bacterium]